MKNRKTRLRAAVAVGFLFAVGPRAFAQESPWSLAVGAGHVQFNPRSSLSMAGADVPGAAIDVDNSSALGLIIGYDVAPDWSVRLGIGSPPKTTLRAAGSLRAFAPPLTGALGEVKYAPATLSAVYQFGPLSRLRPYVGVGINYTWVMSTTDGDVRDFTAQSAWGSVLEAGFDVALTEKVSVNFEAKKIYVKVRASGNVPALGGAPVTATVRLDPLILFAGLRYRF